MDLLGPAVVLLSASSSFAQTKPPALMNVQASITTQFSTHNPEAQGFSTSGSRWSSVSTAKKPLGNCLFLFGLQLR